MIYTGIITEKNLKDDLIDFGMFDYDANGSNGEIYLLDEAKEKGFDNNLEYWADLAQSTYDNYDPDNKYIKFADAIDVFVLNFTNSWTTYNNGEKPEYSINVDLTGDNGPECILAMYVQD